MACSAKWQAWRTGTDTLLKCEGSRRRSSRTIPGPCQVFPRMAPEPSPAGKRLKVIGVPHQGHQMKRGRGAGRAKRFGQFNSTTNTVEWRAVDGKPFAI